MKESNDILQRAGRNDGLRVPDGYFADFVSRMETMLPPKDDKPAVVNRSLWSRVRPYVYMAAMFAGVWCMLKMFTLMMPPTAMQPIDSNPVVAEAFSNETFVNDYVLNDVSQWDIYDNMIDEGVDVDALCDSLAATCFSFETDSLQ